MESTIVPERVTPNVLDDAADSRQMLIDAASEQSISGRETPRRSRRDGNHAGPALQLTVRSARLADVVGVRRIADVVQLNLPEELLGSFQPLRRCLAGTFGWSRSRSKLFVAQKGGNVVGFAQTEQALPDQRWILTHLGAGGSGEFRDRIWEALLSHLVVSAGRHGVKRVFARVNEQDPFSNALRQLGFVAYAEEEIFVLEGGLSGDAPAGLRRQEQTDTWAIHQLYNAAVPKDVQYAEAFTSHRWDVARRPGRMPKHGVMAGWLVEEGHHVVGHVRVASHDGIHVLELVSHPDRRDVVGLLLDGALAYVARHQPKQVYCAVRSYQAEAATALEARGFTVQSHQRLYVKYTAATVRVPAFEFSPVLSDVRDRFPQRVPTFLQGKPHDESLS